MRNNAPDLRSERERTGTRWLWRDAFCVLVLVLLSIATRGRLVGGAGNIDEDWYLAAAAYNLANGLSAYEIATDNFNSTIAIYQLSAEIFGVYNRVPLGWLVCGYCALVASLLYGWLARSTTRLLGFAAGIVFVLGNPRWEGWATNREWLALPFLTVGLVLAGCAFRPKAQKTERTYRVLLGLAGCAFALAFIMKDQALPFLLLVPCVVAIRCFFLQGWRSAALDLVSYSLGVVLSLCIFLLVPFWLHDSVGIYISELRNRIFHEGFENQVQVFGGAAGAIQSLWQGLYTKHVPMLGAGLLLLGYIALLVQSARLVFRAVCRRRSAAATGSMTDELLALVNAWLALAAVQAGGRFFWHYFLFLLPACLALLVTTLHGLATDKSKPYVILGSAALFLGAAAQGAIDLCVTIATSRIIFVFLVLAFSLAASLSLLTLAGNLGLRFRERVLDGLVSRDAAARHNAGPVCSLFVSNAAIWTLAYLGATTVLFGIFCAQGQRISPEKRVGALADLLNGVRRDGDRLFVWGFAPQVYSATRMVPASRFVSCSAVVGDFVQGAERRTSWDERNGAILMADLTASLPEFFVDAQLKSATLSRQSIFALDRYPQLAEFVGSKYRLRHEVDGYRVYVRKDVRR